MQRPLADEVPVGRASDYHRVRTAGVLAIPLIAFFFIQNGVSLASLAMIGRLGNVALAGIGIANAILAAAMALLYGFDTGVQSIVSRATGAGDGERGGRTLTEAICLSGPVGAGLCAFVVSTAPRLISALAPSSAVAAAGSAFLVGAAPSLLFLGIAIPFNAYWIGSARPQISFSVSAIVAPLQIAATWLLVFGFLGRPPLGPAGAGIAVSAATFCGLLIQLMMGLRFKPIPALFRVWPQKDGLASIVFIGWPVSVQQSLLQLGFIVAFAIVSEVGTRSVAILNVLASLTMVPILIATGLGTAGATLVGRALGRCDRADAASWGWQLSIGAAVLTLPVALVACFAPRILLGVFLTDRQTLAQAIWPAQLLGAAISIDAFGRVLAFALRGAGATKIATGIPFFVQSGLQLPLMWLVGVRFREGFDGIVAVQFVLTFLLAAALALVWHRGRWARVGLSVSSRRDKDDTIFEGQSFSRIWIVGGAGAGKSTLARKIGERLDLPVIHLDRLIYGPLWSRNDLDSVRANLEAQLGASWVVEGTYPQVQDLILPRAELVIWLEQPSLIRLWRSWRKTRIHRNAPRADRPDDCDEAFTLGYVGTILSFGRYTNEIEAHLTRATPAPVIRIKGNRAVAKFLRSLLNAARVPLAA